MNNNELIRELNANAHLGACDGCRWNDENMKKWEEAENEIYSNI